MRLTRKQIREHARHWLSRGEVAPYDEGIINDWINMGQEDVWSLLVEIYGNYDLATWDFGFVANKEFYDPPKNLRSVERIYRTDLSERRLIHAIKRREEWQWRELTFANQEDVGWYRRGEKIGILPIVTSTINRNCVGEYHRNPELLLDDDDVSEIPTDLHELIVIETVIRGMRLVDLPGNRTEVILAERKRLRDQARHTLDPEDVDSMEYIREEGEVYSRWPPSYTDLS
jgi:hypothetical protein